jgi:prevent-host-death family protein
MMKTLQLREAKAQFSALVDAAEKGEATIVTKHGRPAAMVVPIEAARKLYPENKPGFAELLMAIPHEISFDRDDTPPREVAF